MLGLVFKLFSSDLRVQLTLLSPFLVLGCLVLVVTSIDLIRMVDGRATLGRLGVLTLLSLITVATTIVLLPVTGTSYGSSRPVILVFGVIFLWFLAGTLLATVWWKRGGKRGSGAPVAVYAALMLFTLSTLAYAFYVEPHWIEVSHTILELPLLPPSTPPIRVAVITDTHIEKWTRRETNVLRKLEAIRPDLVVLVGDYINVDHYGPVAYADLKRFFSALHAPYGVFASHGWTDTYNLERLVEGTDVVLLDDEYATVDVHGARLYVVGIHNTLTRDDRAAFFKVSAEVPRDAPRVLLFHTPDLAEEAAREGYNVYFAGHTHGGQIAIPFYGAIFTASRYGRRYASDLHLLGGAGPCWLYVSRGLGMEGHNTPRARLAARPELPVVTLVPQQTSQYD